MKAKHFILLLLLGASVGGVGYFLHTNDKAAWRSAGDSTDKKILSFDLNAVSRVTLKSTDGELNLVKDGDQWTVAERSGYPASYESATDLIRKVWDLKTAQTVKVGPSQFGRMGLIEPGKPGGTATLIELKAQDGKPLAGLLLGKPFLRKMPGMPGGADDGFPAGRYVMPLGDTKVSLVTEAFEQLTAAPQQWLKRDFLNISRIKSIQLIGSTDTQRWTLQREAPGAEWRLADAKPDEKVDPAKVAAFETLFPTGGFVDVVAPDAKPETTGLDKPATATIVTFDQFTYVVKFGKLQNDSVPVAIAISADLSKARESAKDETPEEKTKRDQAFADLNKRLQERLSAEKWHEKHAYLVFKSALDPLLRERAALLAEKGTTPAHPTLTAPPAAAPPRPQP